VLGCRLPFICLLWHLPFSCPETSIPPSLYHPPHPPHPSITPAIPGTDYPLYAPALLGACLGGLFAALHRHASVRLWRPPAAPLRLVITGGTRGLGKALARQALLAGDAVVITGRTHAAAAAAAAELRCEVEALVGMREGGGEGEGRAAGREPVEVFGVACDVSDAAQVRALGAASAALLGGVVDAWIINAGQSGSFRSFLEADDEALEQVCVWMGFCELGSGARIGRAPASVERALKF